MLAVLRGSWALFLGIMVAGTGAGLYGTLMGVRGALEGFSPFGIAFAGVGYFTGFIIGAIIVPAFILRVGHVRVFAAVASMGSICLLFYPVFPNVPAWFFLCFFFGISVCGCLLVAARWLNNATTVETRAQIISIYVLSQLVGVLLSQVLIIFFTASDYTLFVISSVAFSFSLAPMVLSIGPARGEDAQKQENQIKLVDITPMGAVGAFVPGQTFHAPNPMGLGALLIVAPLGAVGMFLLGGLFAAPLNFAASFGMEKGLPITSIAVLTAATFIGGAALQYPMSLLSDRMNRQWLIVAIALIGAAICFYGAFNTENIFFLAMAGFTFGGALNPLYSLYMAYTKDTLPDDDMPSASVMLMVCNAIGAIIGSLVLGGVMTIFGPDAYFIYISGLMAMCGIFALCHIVKCAIAPVKTT